MNKSESIENLAKALVEVQKTELFALTDKDNPFFKSKYADLSSVWTAARHPLTANGLAVIQTMDIADNGVIIETTLIHTSGEYVSGRLLIAPEKKTPQGVGSAITYGRRYGLSAIIGISPEDDDAENAMNRKSQNKAQNKKETGESNKEISRAQWKYIKDTGAKKDLTEAEVIELVKWVTEQNSLTPRHWKLSKLLLPLENFEAQLEKFLEAKSNESPIDEPPDFNNVPY